MGGIVAILLNLLGKRGRRARVFVDVVPAAHVELDVARAVDVVAEIGPTTQLEIAVERTRVGIEAEVSA